MIWGPASPEASLRDRIARYISAPLSPVEVRELPCDVSFRHAPTPSGRSARRGSAPPPSPTAGRRSATVSTTATPRSPTSPTTSPALGADLERLEEDWISGFALAQDTSLLIHDGQYTDAEYPDHVGWGHSPLRDSLAFARRTGAERTVLFHHDPLHSDEFLDRFGAEAKASWAALGGDPAAIELAAERAEYELPARAPSRAAATALSATLFAVPSTPRIDAAAERSQLIGEALEMARQAHAGQLRNGSGGMPYIEHPLAVAELLAGHGFAETVLAAGLLHDVVEESDVEVEEIRRRFGDRVARAGRGADRRRRDRALRAPQGRPPAPTSRRPAATRWRSTPPTSSPTSAPCGASTPARARRSATS